MGIVRRSVLALTLLIAGCANVVVLHPISTQDIIAVKKDQIVTAPKDGFFLSNEYLAEVAKCKVR